MYLLDSGGARVEILGVGNYDYFPTRLAKNLKISILIFQKYSHENKLKSPKLLKI